MDIFFKKIDFVDYLLYTMGRKEVTKVYTGKLISNFKDRLNDLCSRSELNDTELARKLDVSKQTISAWKCGTRSPKPLTVEMIANRFGVAIDWLMGFDVPEEQEKKPIPEDELDNELINLLSDLTPQEIVRVIDFVAGLKAARAGEVSPHK